MKYYLVEMKNCYRQLPDGQWEFSPPKRQELVSEKNVGAYLYAYTANNPHLENGEVGEMRYVQPKDRSSGRSWLMTLRPVEVWKPVKF